MSTIYSSSTQLRCDESALERFLALPRDTPSVKRLQKYASSGDAESGAEQLRCIFLTLDKRSQNALRSLAYERMILEAKMESVLERLEDNELAWGMEDGDEDMGVHGTAALQRLQTAVDDSTYNLNHLVGKEMAKRVLKAIWAEDMQQFLKLTVLTEEEARALHASNWEEATYSEQVFSDSVSCAPSIRSGVRGGIFSPSRTGSVAERGAKQPAEAAERAARLWRRRLWKLTIPVRIDAKLRWATSHDDCDRNGNRSLVNELNRRDPEEAVSYYQKRALQYGPSRERRGSTGTAGRLQQLLSVEQSAKNSSALEYQLEKELYGENILR
jgi:hypothetical protein